MKQADSIENPKPDPKIGKEDSIGQLMPTEGSRD